MIKETYRAESGDRDQGPDTDEVTARNTARFRRCRLMRKVEEDGVLTEDSLVFDYGAGSGRGPDDTGAEECDECERWTIELVDAAHAENCSLNPRNIQGTPAYAARVS
jgi:hypothetical protein